MTTITPILVGDTMTTISDLPLDLVEEVLSRVPVTSLRAVRFTCTKWNTVSKHQSFRKKQIGNAAKKKEFPIIMMDFRVYLISVNLHGIHKEENVKSSIMLKGNDSDGIDISEIFHCDGLLLYDFLICFDFATERFGPHLPLPDYYSKNQTATLSIVGDDKLAILIELPDHCEETIWITNKIEPNDVSWSKVFLDFHWGFFTDFKFPYSATSFFIDRKENVAVLFDRDRDLNMAYYYIIGKDGYITRVELGKSADDHWFPLACSYVPSSVQIQQATRGKRKRPL